MASLDSITCSFAMDRDMYNQYRSIVVRNGKTVKGDLIEYMKTVVANQASNEVEKKAQD